MDIGWATFSGPDERLSHPAARACKAPTGRLQRYPVQVRALIWTGLALLAWGGLGGMALGALTIVRVATGLT